MVRTVPGYALHHPNHPIEIRITRVPDSTPIPVPGPAPIDSLATLCIGGGMGVAMCLER